MARSGASIAIVIVIIAAIAVTQTGNDGPDRGPRRSNARICQDAGYLRLTRADGTRFGTEEDCLTYAEEGGTMHTIPPTATVRNTPAPPTATPTPRPMSIGCQTLNMPGYDAHYTVLYVPHGPFHAGERIAITATLPVTVATPTSIKFRFADAEEETAFPGTVIFVVSEDLTTDVSWTVRDGAATWFVSCAT